jgi:secondary thiamine-phosphate synthase enzyme
MISLETKGNGDIIDITKLVEEKLAETGVKDGIVTVFAPGSTVSITAIEYEPGVLADYKAMWERVVPQDISYQHNTAWAEWNGHSHVRASTLGPSLVVPVSEKKLTLGIWQQLALLDFDDRPRSRQVVVQVMGE